jgi:hypothetical protein
LKIEVPVSIETLVVPVSTETLVTYEITQNTISLSVLSSESSLFGNNHHVCIVTCQRLFLDWIWLLGAMCVPLNKVFALGVRELCSENVLVRGRLEGDGAEGKIILGLRWVNCVVKVWD